MTAGRSLGFAASFAIPVILARTFSQADFGTYKQLFLIYATLYGIAQVGMAESLYYFLPGARQRAGRHVSNALAALAVAGGLCMAVLWVSRRSISLWMTNADLARHIPELGLFLGLMLASAALEILMVARNRYVEASATYLVSDILKAAMLLGPALMLGSIDALLAGAVGFAALRCGGMLLYVWREFRSENQLDWSLWKQQVAYAGPYALAVGIDVVQANFHQYAVASQVDATLFAIYAVGCLQIPFVDLVAISAANVMMVKMGEELREGRRRALLALWHATTIRLAFVLFPLAGLLLLSAREIIVVLFTETYLASVPIFVVSSTAVVLAALSVDAVLRVYAQTRLLLALNVLRLAIIAASIQWFLSAFHLAGAVLVTVLATAVVKAIGIASMRRMLQVSFTEVLPWRTLAAISIAAAGAAIPVLLIRPTLTGPALSRLVVIGAIYGLCYVALGWLLPAVGEPLRRTLGLKRVSWTIGRSWADEIRRG